MIRLHRGDEPGPLTEVRDGPKGPTGVRVGGELDRVKALRAAGTLTSSQLGTQYTVVKNALAKQQYFQCAYCECREQPTRNDVEHYRPKGNVAAWKGTPSAAGYWWLTWTWQNLLFSCANCNQGKAKHDKFPLKDPATRLQPTSPPPGREEPLILDPYETDGTEHIEFRNQTIAGHRQWRPVGLTDEGRAYIEILMLDRSDLLELYELHVEQDLGPEVERLKEADAAENPILAAEAARQLHRRCRPNEAFSGLSRDAIPQLLGDLAQKYAF